MTRELHSRINTSIIFYAMLFSFRCHNDNESFSPFSFRFLFRASVWFAGRFWGFIRLLGEIKTSLMARNLHVLLEIRLVNFFCCFVIGSLGGRQKLLVKTFKRKLLIAFNMHTKTVGSFD